MPTVYSYSGELWLHYDVAGEGRNPTVLVHGFASDHVDNWAEPGWTRALVRAGHRVVALDCRGHGQSDRPHAPEAYHAERMADDVLDVMTYANARSAHLMGYSMGGSIALRLLARHPERFRSVVIGGIGDGVLDDTTPRNSSAIADALLARDPASIQDPAGRAFRRFAERRSNDLEALAACMRRERPPIDRAALARVDIPVLVVIGEKDTLAGSADGLAAAIPTARVEVVPGDHVSCLAEPRFREVVLDFLAEAKAAAKRSRG